MPKRRPSEFWDLEQEGEHWRWRPNFERRDVARRRAPPKGFISWDAYETNRAYGASEYKYDNFTLGNAQTVGRYQLNVQNNWDDPNNIYGYNGFGLHPRLDPGYDRSQMIGNTIELRSLDLAMSIMQRWDGDFEITDKFAMARIIICLDNEATSPVKNNIDFANGRGDSTLERSQQLLENGKSLYSHYNLDVTSRYTVLYDEVHNLEAASSYKGDEYRFNENGAGKTEGAVKTNRESHEKLYQVVCENGTDLFSNEGYLAAKAEIALTTEGTMEGTGVGANIIDLLTTDIPLISNTTLNFKEVAIVPGVDASGAVVQDQAKMELSLNPVRHIWKLSTSEWVQKIHIDFTDTICKMQRWEVAGQEKMYWEDYAIYLGIQLLTKSDAQFSLFVDSRLTYWDN